MKVYLVGGAVRDQLLGQSVKDRDWVVVGATPEILRAQGYRDVGQDFPVFLHPETQEEYALARTERKVGQGYRGFECDAAVTVTLEEDLKRRDLTINAMAQDSSGGLIDPFGGQNDLENRILRHVSDAFVEDPLRALRIARFAAKLPDFQIAEDTWALLLKMRDQGELSTLVPERIWQEIIKALSELNPRRFFEVLDELGVLTAVTQLWLDRPQCEGIECLPTDQTFKRFLWCCLGQSEAQLEVGFKHLVVPSAWRTPARWMAQSVWSSLEMNAECLIQQCTQMDAWRRPNRFLEWLSVCRVHPQLKSRYSAQFVTWQAVFTAARAVNVKVLQAQGYQGPELGQAIANERIRLAQTVLMP
ncbi:MAG: multifunctional CCA tRNA nucleotidyl transferase/2'3'-cyclic phosphodiesterase/2'nucleotidase/phosphatase [Legionellales bacterium]|nr:multifunctional CCA tRNA nucleotidyl transferase/2'3'-cyclic phosphodiesterase/2'nucleotidase/phosphatase [Legionellales bacterium]|tara:strand:+ start:664 stop:1743 length:1080 start_codon:yes stop_codon:yes gene_type:complete